MLFLRITKIAIKKVGSEEKNKHYENTRFSKGGKRLLRLYELQKRLYEVQKL